MLWKLLFLFVVVPLVELTLLLFLADRTHPLVALADIRAHWSLGPSYRSWMKIKT